MRASRPSARPNPLKSKGEGLVYVAFDLLHVDGQDIRSLSSLEREDRLAKMLIKQPASEGVRYSEHEVGGGPEFYKRTCN